MQEFVYADATSMKSTNALAEETRASDTNTHSASYSTFMQDPLKDDQKMIFLKRLQLLDY